MPKLAANLSTLFTEYKFLDRFEAAAGHGFKGVEVQFPYDWSIDAIAKQLMDHQLDIILLNAPPGNAKDGDRGLAAIPGKEAEFSSSIQLALRYASELSCPNIHVMAGIIEGESNYCRAKTTFLNNLKLAAAMASEHNINLLIEPINNKRSIPGYFLTQVPEAKKLINEINQKNIGLQFDLFHAQIMHGDLEKLINDNIDITRHFQVAGLSARQEPNLGELNYKHLFNVIDSLNYSGWIGCEYTPSNSTSSGLGWASDYGITVES